MAPSIRRSPRTGGSSSFDSGPQPTSWRVTRTGPADVFLHDRDAGTTTLVSVPAVAGTGGNSLNPVISGDGRYVAFQSAASTWCLPTRMGSLTSSARPAGGNDHACQCRARRRRVQRTEQLPRDQPRRATCRIRLERNESRVAGGPAASSFTIETRASTTRMTVASDGGPANDDLVASSGSAATDDTWRSHRSRATSWRAIPTACATPSSATADVRRRRA